MPVLPDSTLLAIRRAAEDALAQGTVVDTKTLAAKHHIRSADTVARWVDRYQREAIEGKRDSHVDQRVNPGDLLELMRSIGSDLGVTAATAARALRRKVEQGEDLPGTLVALLTAQGITIDKIRDLRKEEEYTVHRRVLMADDEEALDMMIASFTTQYNALRDRPMVR